MSMHNQLQGSFGTCTRVFHAGLVPVHSFTSALSMCTEQRRKDKPRLAREAKQTTSGNGQTGKLTSSMCAASVLSLGVCGNRDGWLVAWGVCR